MAGSLSFYKRVLPKGLVAFSSSEGRELFRRALTQGNMESYFDLAAQYVTQSRPEDCARSTLVMTLNALNLDPGKVWMTPWRWYSEGVLNCLDPKPGMSLHEFARTALCNGTHIQAYYPLAEKARNTQSLSEECDTHQHHFNIKFASEDTFRIALKASVRRSGLIFVVNHSRKALEQTGDGHYSPVAGLDEEADKALVMDVARFKYPPFWVPVPKLYESLQWIDPDTDKMRGFLLLSRSSEFSPACRFSIDTTSMARIGGKYENSLSLPHKDFLPLLYCCYFAISGLMTEENTELIREIEGLRSFSVVKSGKIHESVHNLLGEIAESHRMHFLALVHAAISPSFPVPASIASHVERIRIELGLTS